MCVKTTTSCVSKKNGGKVSHSEKVFDIARFLLGYKKCNILDHGRVSLQKIFVSQQKAER